MDQLINKIESYHIFNYLIPGSIFCIIFSKIINQNIFQTNMGITIIIYYFVGLVLSRIGSIIIEPILKRTKIIRKREYKDYIQSEDNEKVKLLQRDANQYRTYIATFLLLSFIETYFAIIRKDSIIIIIIFLLLMILFIFSYRKQLQFIVSRLK